MLRSLRRRRNQGEGGTGAPIELGDVSQPGEETPGHVEGTVGAVDQPRRRRELLVASTAGVLGGALLNSAIAEVHGAREEELRGVAADYYQRGHGVGDAEGYSRGLVDGEQSAQGELQSRLERQRALDREAADNRVDYTVALQPGNGINQAVQARVAQVSVTFTNLKGEFRVDNPLVLISAEAGDFDPMNMQNTRLGFIERRDDRLLVRELDEPAMAIAITQKGGGDLVNSVSLYRGVSLAEGDEQGKGTPTAFARYKPDDLATEFMPAQLVAVTALQ